MKLGFVVVASLTVATSVSAQTYSTYGNHTYGSDGSTYSTYGNHTYGSDGSTYSRYGNHIYGTQR